jgi:bacteriocin-like protein
MSKKNKKIEKTDAKTAKVAKASELSDKDLDNVAGGATYSTSRSNIRGAK